MNSSAFVQHSETASKERMKEWEKGEREKSIDIKMCGIGTEIFNMEQV